MTRRTERGCFHRKALLASALVSAIYALGEGPLPAAGAVDSGLLEQVRNRLGKTEPLSSRQLAAKNALIQAVFQLDVYLSAQGKNGAAWKTFLKLDDLRAAVRTGAEPSDDLLAAHLARFRSNFAGLERPICGKAALALDNYRRVAGEVARSTTQAQIDEQLKALAQALAAVAEPPTRDQVRTIGELVEWFSDRGLEPDLIAGIHGRLSYPNLSVHVSQDLVGNGSMRRINDLARPVRDVIMGTTIVGTGDTTGWSRTRLVPHAAHGLFEVTVNATNTSRSMGYNGPAYFALANTTPLSATKRFSLDSAGFRVWGASSRAEAHSQILCIGSNKPGLRGKIVRRVAAKRSARQKHAAEQVASRHAEQQFNARIDVEANAVLGKAHADYLAKIRHPLLRLAQWPREIRLASTSERLHVGVLHDSAARFAATLAPPDVPHGATMAVQLHESLVNNYGDGLLAGRTLRQADLDRLSMQMFGKRPPQLAADEEKGPWTMTFASAAPIELRVDGGRASFTLRGRRFGSVDRLVETPLDITAHYELLLENGAAKGKRVGEDIQVHPTGFERGKRKMTLREIRDASFVRNRFNDFFTEEITSQGLVLPGQWAHAGRLELVQLFADGGWVSLAWRRADATPETN